MRKADFVRDLQRITDELRVGDLVNFLRVTLNRGTNAAVALSSKDVFAGLIFESQVGYHALMRDPQVAKILESLQVGRFYTTAKLRELMTAYSNIQHNSDIHNNPGNWSSFSTFFEILQWLLVFRDTCSRLLMGDGAQAIPPENKILELEMIDFEGTGIDVTRVQALFSALEALRMQISLFLKLPESHLTVHYIESGSEIRISVEGLGDIIDGLRNLFTEIWTRIVNRKFDRIDRRNASIEGDFELIYKIQRQVEEGLMPAEDGERFKLQILAETQALLDSGTMLAEVPTVEPINRKKLLAEGRSIKLLGSGEPADVTSSPE